MIYRAKLKRHKVTNEFSLDLAPGIGTFPSECSASIIRNNDDWKQHLRTCKRPFNIKFPEFHTLLVCENLHKKARGVRVREEDDVGLEFIAKDPIVVLRVEPNSFLEIDGPFQTLFNRVSKQHDVSWLKED